MYRYIRSRRTLRTNTVRIVPRKVVKVPSNDGHRKRRQVEVVKTIDTVSVTKQVIL